MVQKELIRAVLVLILAIILVMALGCVSIDDDRGEELTIFAAASLTGAVLEISEAYGDVYPEIIIIHNFDNSNALLTQIEHGAKADIFISADPIPMNTLVDKGYIDNTTVSIVLENSLAIAIPVANTAGITGIGNLADPGVRLVIGAEGTPFGRYTRIILENYEADPDYGSAFVDMIYANIVSEEMSVSNVMPKILLGEADASFLYKSDILKSNGDQVVLIGIPERYNVIAEYPAGILKESSHMSLAEDYLEFLKGPKGNSVLDKYGFDPIMIEAAIGEEER